MSQNGSKNPQNAHFCWFIAFLIGNLVIWFFLKVKYINFAKDLARKLFNCIFLWSVVVIQFATVPRALGAEALPEVAVELTVFITRTD